MAWQTIDGEMVLLDIDGNQLMGVNPVAARIWDLCVSILKGNDLPTTIFTAERCRRRAKQFLPCVPETRSAMMRFIRWKRNWTGSRWLAARRKKKPSLTGKAPARRERIGTVR